MTDFPIGSVVVLKSGGPKMTVVKHEKSSEDDTFTHQVIWYETSNPAFATASGEGEHHTGVPQTRFFPPEALKSAE